MNRSYRTRSKKKGRQEERKTKMKEKRMNRSYRTRSKKKVRKNKTEKTTMKEVKKER